MHAQEPTDQVRTRASTYTPASPHQKQLPNTEITKGIAKESMAVVNKGLHRAGGCPETHGAAAMQTLSA